MAEIPTACEEEELDAVQLVIVQAVEKYPELYDKGHKDYKKRVQKIRLWDKIAKELSIPGKDMFQVDLEYLNKKSIM